MDRGVSAESLRAVAGNTTDPLLLLGLSFMAQANDPVRAEIIGLTLRAKPEYVPMASILSVAMDCIDADSVGELVRSDPDNALGHYLQGVLFHVGDHASEALGAFRKAASCAELRLYDATLGEALFKAVEALQFHGLDRLCALSWTVSRWASFSSFGIQPIYWAISELARQTDAATRSELTEILISLAGHLFTTNFFNRWFSQRAIDAAFLLKAEGVGNRNPQANGYATAVYGLNMGMFVWPGLEEWSRHNPRQLAQFLPSRIHRAFAAADPLHTNAQVLGETNFNPPAQDQAAFAAAKANAMQAAQKLLDLALTDPDGILGAYLKGVPGGRDGNAPWASFGTPVESVLQKRPDLLRAAAANEDAMDLLWRAGENEPSRQNMQRILELAWAIQNYARTHDQNFPDNIAILVENGLLKPGFEATSVLTGRPYVYVARGEKCPVKMNDRAQFILLYDETSGSNFYPCAFASCAGSQISKEELAAQLRKRGK